MLRQHHVETLYAYFTQDKNSQTRPTCRAAPDRGWAVGPGITVNAMAPGAIETDLVRKMHDTETRKSYCARIAANRYGTPEEVASVAAFLLSRDASYVNGVIMPVDGGFMGGGVIKRKMNPGDPANG